MTDQYCTHHFEHVKQTRPFTEREYMQCTKCGLQNPLGLFQHWDTERDGPAVKWPPRDNGGKLPIGPQWKEWVKEHQEILRKINRNPRYLQPIVKVEKHSDWGGGKGAWAWDCRTCAYTGYHPTWATAYHQATHHAHNHHRSQK